MNNYQTCVLSPNFRFELSFSREKNELSDDVINEVEAIWQREERIRKEELFNGRVLSLIHLDSHKVVAEYIEYKQFLAFVLEPSLRIKLGIKPLSLSCLTRTSKAVLVGRRAKSVMQYPSFLELAPSGGIDSGAAKGENIDVLGQAMRELEEETGFLANDVDRMEPTAIIHDLNTGIYEVCVEIMLLEKDRGSLESTLEYSELKWINNEDIASFLENNGEEIVPLSKHLLSGWVDWQPKR